MADDQRAEEMSDVEKRMCVGIEMDEDDPLGAMPDEKLCIVRVQPMTHADGKLKVGDRIVSVNGTRVEDRAHFYQLLRVAHSNAELEIIRRKNDATDADHTNKSIDDSDAAIEKNGGIPPEREKFIERHAGFEYSLIRIDGQRGRRLGLGIRDVSNRVLVSKVERGSLAEQKLSVGDHIVDVDGTRVSDKDVARELIILNMRANGYFTSVIGRAVTADARKLIEEDLSIKHDAPSVKLNDDVRQIAQQQRQREAQLRNHQRPSLLTTGEPKIRPHVTFNDAANRHFEIGNDNKGKCLRPVRK